MAPASEQINRVLQSVKELQPLPTSIGRILRATDDPDVTANTLSELIGLDQALSAKILQMANSATLGYGPPCSLLSEAVMRLGFQRIRTIVLAVGAASPLTRGLNGYRLGGGQLWTHSVATATAAEWLSKALNYPNPEEAYVAGLLHDIGKLLLDQFVLLDYKQILYSVQIQKKSLCEAEEELIGINHAKVGSLMAQKWRFPEILVEAIYCHHTPSLAFDQPKLAAIINVANAFSIQEGGIIDKYGQAVHPESMRILNLDDKKVAKMQEEMNNYFKIKSSGL